MSALERCPGCGERRLLFPGGRCLDCEPGGGQMRAGAPLPPGGQLELDIPSAEGMDPPPLELRRRASAGAASLLHRLVAGGLDPGAVPVAAALVHVLDEEARA